MNLLSVPPTGNGELSGVSSRALEGQGVEEEGE